MNIPSYQSSMTSTNTSLNERLAAFKQNFGRLMQSGGQLVGRRQTGYEELSQGLMDHEEGVDDSHTSIRPGQTAGTYQGPLPGFEGGASDDAAVAAAISASQSHVPSQVRQIHSARAPGVSAGR